MRRCPFSRFFLSVSSSETLKSKKGSQVSSSCDLHLPFLRGGWGVCTFPLSCLHSSPGTGAAETWSHPCLLGDRGHLSVHVALPPLLRQGCSFTAPRGRKSQYRGMCAHELSQYIPPTIMDSFQLLSLGRGDTTTRTLKKKLSVYLWMCWVFAPHRLSLVAASRSYSLVAVCGLLIAVVLGFSASLVASTSSRVHRPGSPMACGIRPD